MCWSAPVTYAMVGAGVAATVWTIRRGEPPAIWGTLAYFTAMEALQATGYAVIDQCDAPLNKTVTLLSYLHIAFQPFVINLFAMALIARPISAKARRIVLGLALVSAASIVGRLLPFGWAGHCLPGQVLCGEAYCTISGEWHLGWTVPWYDLWGLLPWVGPSGFPEYLLAAFVLPLFYGAWRFSLFHLLVGPLLAWSLTDNPNEMPAIWCLFSIGIVLVALSPLIRRTVAPPLPA
ncbi:DUF5765 domain-containing protein [Primorskyibacter sp. 2E233]|uniref:DUF5765 domain-containing protein n=1 Tax=Primorskyibacter sp. 2E233 TaxID=3413431 RepID=UPI003BEFAE94